MNLNDITIEEKNTITEYMPSQKYINLLTNFYSSFADSTRLKIIMCLTIMPLCVGDISAVLKINTTTISHQLKILKNYNVVDFCRNGKSVRYFINNDYVEGIINNGVESITS